MEEQVYTIQEAAVLTGLTAHTLRYYEKEGLLPGIERSENGRRQYSDNDIESVKVINCLKETGMSIQAIREYVSELEGSLGSNKERLDLYVRQREVLVRKMKKLQEQLDMADYKIWYYQNIGKLVPEEDPLHCQKMRDLYKAQFIQKKT